MVSAPSGTAAAMLRRTSRSTRCTASGRVAWYSSTVAGRSPMRAAWHVGVTRATGRRRKVAPTRKGARMHVGIKEGGDGVRCWNRQAVTAYAEQVNRREAQIAQQNPDVVVLPGRLVCYGCEVMEYDYGIKCTAQLTRTRYAVRGETEPD